MCLAQQTNKQHHLPECGLANYKNGTLYKHGSGDLLQIFYMLFLL